MWLAEIGLSKRHFLAVRYDSKMFAFATLEQFDDGRLGQEVFFECGYSEVYEGNMKLKRALTELYESTQDSLITSFSQTIYEAKVIKYIARKINVIGSVHWLYCLENSLYRQSRRRFPTQVCTLLEIARKMGAISKSVTELSVLDEVRLLPKMSQYLSQEPIIKRFDPMVFERIELQRFWEIAQICGFQGDITFYDYSERTDNKIDGFEGNISAQLYKTYQCKHGILGVGDLIAPLSEIVESHVINSTRGGYNRYMGGILHITQNNIGIDWLGRDSVLELLGEKDA